MCTHKANSKDLLEKHQDQLFKEISEFTLINSTNKDDINVHESSVSFFYNLIAAFHLDNSVRIQKKNPNPTSLIDLILIKLIDLYFFLSFF